ncbi:MAG: immunoglobulin domain-containing protein [Phycisphaerae bacterium]|nr:immunoglobulin domain-containing protein [Phycisphaerae bacterium]
MIRQSATIGIAVAVLAIATRVNHATTVSVVFERDGRLQPVERLVPDGLTELEAAVYALVNGPTAQEIQEGYTSNIPTSVTVVSLNAAEDTVTVDLSPEILTGLDEAALLAIFDQFRTTLGDFAWVLAIRLTCDNALLASYLEPVVFDTWPAAPDRLAIEPAPMGLGGRNITIGPSHGRFWNGSGWYWQRSDPCGFGEAVLEDTNSIRLMQFLYQYLVQDGATVHVPRTLTESTCCQSDTGLHWWKMAAYSWLRQAGLPCSVYASSSGICSSDMGGVSRVSDDIRARPLFADYRGSHIYIAHHTNAAGGTGTETFRDTAMEHPAHEANSYTLALAANNNIVNAIRDMYDAGWANRGVKDSAGGFGEIRIPDRPAILIELAFHDRCDKDALYLVDNFFRSVSQWGLYKGICEYFGTSPTWDKYSCEYVSDTIPPVMGAGLAYPVSITFRNRGVLWSNARNFRLGAVGDSDPFTAFNRVNISGEVRPGNTYTFSFTMVAPAAPGSYITDWRMVRDGVAWFGPTLTKQVDVSGGGPLPPIITLHPSNQTIAPYGTASFTVGAVGDAPLSYQWQKDGGDLADGGKISGATSTNLQIVNADGSDQGSYRCVVTNPIGSATSNAASLTLAPTVFMVESRSGGQNFAKYSESGTWADTTGKSSAPGVTGGIGARYGSTYRSVAGEKHAFFKANLALAGPYEVFATWAANSNRRSPILHRISHAGGVTDVNVDQAAAANTWVSLGIFTFNAGTDVGEVDVNNLNIDVSGSMYADAVKWEWRGAPAPPTITQHPTAQNVCPDDTATFTVAASGTGTLTYQWQKNGANLTDSGNISGALTAALAVSNVATGDVSQYRCVVSNAGGSTNSNQATLTLKAATAITAQPMAQDVCEGAAASFTVTATGDGALSYQWQKNGDDLSDGGNVFGATTATVEIDPVTAGDAASYRCVVTAGCGSIPSDEAPLTLKAATQITTQPQSQQVARGGTATFTVAGSGAGTLAYQWQKNGDDMPGEQFATLEITGCGNSDVASYRCIVTDDCGSVASDEASLTLPAPGDFDLDNDVDLTDFSTFQACFNGPNRPYPSPGCFICDFDEDNDVDLADFGMFAACFNGPNRPPACQ